MAGTGKPWAGGKCLETIEGVCGVLGGGVQQGGHQAVEHVIESQPDRESGIHGSAVIDATHQRINPLSLQVDQAAEMRGCGVDSRERGRRWS